MAENNDTTAILISHFLFCLNFTTHSFFAPYVTTIGLYNDHGDLLAVAKTSRPVRNDPEIALSFIVRFDI